VFLGMPIIILAIQFNNRRLAWVSFVFSLALLYLLLPASAPKRRLNRMGLFLLPVLLGYVVIGWGRPERIYSPLTGTGWGHKYVELSNKYTIAAQMELWQYIPHNSSLGLFAYTGLLGIM